MVKFGTNASGATGEITQVKEAIPWVRCASGNVNDCGGFCYSGHFCDSGESDDSIESSRSCESIYFL